MSVRIVVGLAIMLAGCGERAPTTVTAAPAAVSPTPTAAVEREPAPTAELATPIPATAPPPGPTLPDGTAIAPCEDAPANMACVPGGPFVRGTDDGPENARPRGTIALQTFYMDLFEVTIAEYKACVAAGECPKGGPFYPDFSRPHQPIVGVTWFGARTFCAKKGKHLPTEAQWEKAARGPDGAAFPWGDEKATCRRSVIKDKQGRSCGTPMQRSSTPYKGRTFVVGSRPAGAYGLFDMAGNAWEYVADWYTPSWTACGKDCDGVDPKGPCGGADDCPGFREKLVKGGSWYWESHWAAGWVRRPQPPTNRPFHHFGFRCAASVEEATKLRGVPRDPLAPVPGEKNSDAGRGM